MYGVCTFIHISFALNALNHFTHWREHPLHFTNRVGVIVQRDGMTWVRTLGSRGAGGYEIEH